MAQIRDYALISDLRTAALISRGGSIDWLCLPRFDAGSTFAKLLDPGAGSLEVHPEGQSYKTSRRYREGTLVLDTEFEGSEGAFTLTDALLLPDDDDPPYARRLLRMLTATRGQVEVTLKIAARFDYGQVRPWIRPQTDGMRSVLGGNDGMLLWATVPLETDGHHDLTGRFSLKEGERGYLMLAYCPPEMLESERGSVDPKDLDERLARTESYWRRFTDGLNGPGDQAESARRSALVLKALTHAPTGSILAAPTTSLPEAIGAERNWDYRYAWVRDASFSSRALAELGATEEAEAFRRFIMRSAAGHAGDLQVVYGPGGERRLNLQKLDLKGYENSRPVQVGNGAAGQRQLDAYGELVNLSWRAHERDHSPDDEDWRFLVSLINHACHGWPDPDHGIWEWPGEPQHFVHSKVLCWSALDRGIRMAEDTGHDAPLDHWREARDKIRETVDARGYDERRGVYTQCFDRPEMDSALLLLPTVEYLDWKDERMVRTVAAIREELGAGDGLLYRYRRDDGLQGKEGAFLCCSFWLAECLAKQGEIGEARAVYDSVMQCANDLGLFSEEVDPETGEALGNFPQGLTHLSQMSAAVVLAAASTPSE